MTENFEDRRKHARIYRNFILSYTIKGEEDEHEVSQINNISRGGVNFVATRPFESGVELSLNIRAPFMSEIISLHGVVLDYKEKISEMIYEVRVKFIRVPLTSEEALKKIESYAAAS